MATPLSCPSCYAPLPGPVHTCPRCALPLTGPAAAELWATEQQLAALTARRSQLLEQLRADGAASGGAAPGAPVGAAGLSTRTRIRLNFASGSGTGSGQQQPKAGWTGQQVLLGAGALLLATAAIVFLAVAWSVLGVAGQVAVMGVITAVCAAAAFGAAARGLRGTAETLSALTVALAVVDAAAAYTLNLAGISALDAAGYAAGICVAIAVAGVAAATHRSHLFTYRLAAVVFAAAAPLLALTAVEPDPAPAAAVLLVAAAAFGAVRRRLPVDWSSIAPLITGTGGSYLLLCWAAALTGLLTDPLLGAGGVAGLISLTAAAGAVYLSRLYRGFAAAGRHPLLAAAGLLAGAVTVVAGAWRPDESALAVLLLAVVAAVVAGSLTLLRPPLRTSSAAVVAVFCHLVLAFALLVGQLTALDEVATHTPVWAVLTLAYTAAAGAATAAAVCLPKLRLFSVGCAAVLVQLAAAAAAYPSGPVASVAAASSAAMLLAGVAAWRRGHPEEWALAGGWGLAVLTAIGYAATSASDQTSWWAPNSSSPEVYLIAGALAAAGLTGLAYGLLPGRGNVAIGGVLLCSAAIWTLLAERDVTTVEAYSLPLAGLIGIVGLVRLYRDRHAPSWLTVGPALSAALLPSALVTVGDDNLFRVLLVLAAGAAVVIGGVLLRWQSPVVTGAVALVIVSASQLGPYAVGLPRWLSFGVVGLVLLSLGARYEQRRRNARQAAQWVAHLR